MIRHGIQGSTATLAEVLGPAAATFSALLIVTGFAKIRRPQDTSRALSDLGLPGYRWSGRALGVLEVTVGGAALAIRSDWLLAGQGVLYATFLAWVLLALIKDVPLASCGCLGTPDTPPYWGHVALVGVAAVVSLLAGTFLNGRIHVATPVEAIAVVMLIAAGTLLSWVIMGDGARLHGASQH